MAFQYSAIKWAKDHRLHHMYSETDADPHNAKRGFFFSHMGWLMSRKHPLVKLKGAGIDISDLKSDPILMFQHNHYWPLVVLCCFIIPTAIPVYFWGETLLNAWCIAVLLRHTITLHSIWTINSLAHFYGNRPYDQ